MHNITLYNNGLRCKISHSYNHRCVFRRHYNKESPSYAQQVPWTPPEQAGMAGGVTGGAGAGGNSPMGMGDPLLLSPSSPSPPTLPTDPPPKCADVSGLSAGQAKLCLLYEEHLASIRYGIQSGLAECRSQFLHRRWNCSMTTENLGSPFLGPDLQTSGYSRV